MSLRYWADMACSREWLDDAEAVMDGHGLVVCEVYANTAAAINDVTRPASRRSFEDMLAWLVDPWGFG